MHENSFASRETNPPQLDKPFVNKGKTDRVSEGVSDVSPRAPRLVVRHEHLAGAPSASSANCFSETDKNHF